MQDNLLMIFFYQFLTLDAVKLINLKQHKAIFTYFNLIEHTTSSSVSKKPRLDQIPAANLDADDPLTDVCILLCRLPFIVLFWGFATDRT